MDHGPEEAGAKCDAALPGVPEASITRKFREFFESEPSTVPRADLLRRLGLRADGKLQEHAPFYYGGPIFVSFSQGRFVLNGIGWRAVSVDGSYEDGTLMRAAALRLWLPNPVPGLPSWYKVTKDDKINQRMKKLVRNPNGQWVMPESDKGVQIDRPVSFRLRQIEQKLLDLQHQREKLEAERDHLRSTVKLMESAGYSV